MNNNIWHWISGLLVIFPLWVLKDAPMPNNETKAVYCFLAVCVPFLVNYFRGAWINRSRPKVLVNWGDIFSCIPVAVVCCFIWWKWFV